MATGRELRRMDTRGAWAYALAWPAERVWSGSANSALELLEQLGGPRALAVLGE